MSNQEQPILLEETISQGSNKSDNNTSQGSTSQPTKNKKKGSKPKQSKKNQAAKSQESTPANTQESASTIINNTNNTTTTDNTTIFKNNNNNALDNTNTSKGKDKKPKQKASLDTSQKQHPLFNKNRAQAKLTVENTDSTSSSSGSNDKEKTLQKRSQNRHKSIPKLPEGEHDMSTLMSYELKTSSYECMICMDSIKPVHRTWTCDCCWAIFHLDCVEKWASKSLKDTSTHKVITQWRCPGCQNAKTAVPHDYFCFCGKQRNPEVPKYNTPHSCEQLCKRHKSCPHECVLLCHPGPCPPCSLMGPVITCYCGHKKRQSRCVDTDYSTLGFSCEDICDELLGCGKHRCGSQCHKGLCPPCETVEVQSCYCGRHERSARCGSGIQIQLRGHIGYYSCNEKCDTVFSCGLHRCQKACHPCSANLLPCPFDPEAVTNCPCNSHTISELLNGGNRKSCTEPIPTCGSVCNKPLPCGHHCTGKCHTGACPPCQEIVDVPCRCQNTTFREICSDVCEAAGGEPPICDRICKSPRNCGRHTCGGVCCPAMKVKGKKKVGIEFVHDCPEPCGRLLSCGKHYCQDKCHKGACRPCLEASFDDVACNCGRTVLEAPVRCGTKLPTCPYPCQRPSQCGHIRFLTHNCHPDEEACPPCSVLVSRNCLCGKTELKNVPCYRESPRCGRPCEKTLSCGKHVCHKTCHNGPCLNEGESCPQVCGATKKCGHACKKKCHGDTPCEDNVPCDAFIKASCICGQNTIDIPCNATADNSGSIRELSCNAYCAKVLRNRRLALALGIKRDDYSSADMSLSSNIDPEKMTYDDLGYYDENICEFYMENIGWCKNIENTLIEFVRNTTRKVIYCKPMKSEYRRFIHRYAIHFNLSTEAVDAEPNRSVIIRKSLGPCRIPAILLSKAANNPNINRPPVPVPDKDLSPSLRTKQPVNALYLSDIAFGLTQLELDSALRPVMNIGGDAINFSTKWMNENDVLITPAINDSISSEDKENVIWQLKKILKNELLDKKADTARRVDCCWVNQNGVITYNEKSAELITKGDVGSNKKDHSVNPFDALHDLDDGWMHVQTNKSESAAPDAWFELPSRNTTPATNDNKQPDAGSSSQQDSREPKMEEKKMSEVQGITGESSSEGTNDWEILVDEI